MGVLNYSNDRGYSLSFTIKLFYTRLAVGLTQGPKKDPLCSLEGQSSDLVIPCLFVTTL